MNKTGNILIKNAVITPDGTEIRSMHRHDYVQHEDANGHTYAVDGGLEYQRRSWAIGEAEEPKDSSVVIDTRSSFSLIRENLCWGTYGEDGEQPLSYVAIKDMDTEHIKNVLQLYEHKLSKLYRGAFWLELAYREAA